VTRCDKTPRYTAAWKPGAKRCPAEPFDKLRAGSVKHLNEMRWDASLLLHGSSVQDIVMLNEVKHLADHNGKYPCNTSRSFAPLKMTVILMVIQRDPLS
jgi:hypothetical protein